MKIATCVAFAFELYTARLGLPSAHAGPWRAASYSLCGAENARCTLGRRDVCAHPAACNRSVATTVGMHGSLWSRRRDALFGYPGSLLQPSTCKATSEDSASLAQTRKANAKANSAEVHDSAAHFKHHGYSVMLATLPAHGERASAIKAATPVPRNGLPPA